MAFREKTAWLTLVCMVIAYTTYFTLMGLRPAPPTNMEIIVTFGAVTVAQAVAVIVGMIVIAVTATREANQPADERDKAIARRGASIAYYVLMVEMILVGVVMPFTEPAWKIIQTALLALVIAQGVQLAVVLLSYRRGWHG
ncbi:hypothetical protein [Sphingomonas sp.]|uniref:hypothetical protein n=1 Tax=Sphingomonas sp. TaxID=28214 RepID=UPI001B0C6C79|nr:hypothetical protein [Sphingomonas sp.]MBO9711299.1 hypothetical protein [Sphingomonas sp.]